MNKVGITFTGKFRNCRPWSGMVSFEVAANGPSKFSVQSHEDLDLIFFRSHTNEYYRHRMATDGTIVELPFPKGVEVNVYALNSTRIEFSIRPSDNVITWEGNQYLLLKEKGPFFSMQQSHKLTPGNYLMYGLRNIVTEFKPVSELVFDAPHPSQLPSLATIGALGFDWASVEGLEQSGMKPTDIINQRFSVVVPHNYHVLKTLKHRHLKAKVDIEKLATKDHGEVPRTGLFQSAFYIPTKEKAPFKVDFPKGGESQMSGMAFRFPEKYGMIVHQGDTYKQSVYNGLVDSDYTGEVGASLKDDSSTAYFTITEFLTEGNIKPIKDVPRNQEF